MQPFSISLSLLTLTSAFVNSSKDLALKAFTPGNTLNKGVAAEREWKREGRSVQGNRGNTE